MKDGDVFRTVTATLEFVLVLALFISNCIADQAVFENSDSAAVPHNCEECHPVFSGTGCVKCRLHAPNLPPQCKTSFLSKSTFVWLTPLIIKGYRKPLTFDDLYMLEEDNTCRRTIPTMEKEWNKEIEEARSRGRRNPASSDQYQTKYQKLKEENSSNGNNDLHDKYLQMPSFAKALFRSVKYPYILGIFLSLVYDLLSFVQPLLLGFMIQFIENPKDYTWHGFLYAVCFFIVAMIQTLLYQNFKNICSQTGLRSKSTITGLIYRKALKLALTAHQETTVGEILNLVSVDSQNIEDLFIYLYFLWSCPICLIIAFIILYQHLGASIFAGFAFLICLIPVNMILAVKVKYFQSEQMKMKDSRMKLLNEILSVMKNIKLYGWEKLFERQITEIRNEECRNLRKSTNIFTLITISWFSAPCFVSLCTFAAYILSSTSNILTVYKAFICLTIFNIINGQLQFLPDAIIYAIQARISLRRINKILLIEELDSENVQVSSSRGNPLKIINGTFNWVNNEKSVLSNINIDIQEGSLVAVVGAVGSGKTSLASALIGEMFKLSGQVKFRGSVAYVPQQAWCLNASVKDNILFNKPMNVYRYNRVIEACALLEDLKTFPSGDETEIGERGINLSGGQKQRISLARAVYQDSSIYILDDPLSAVDSHVGKHIFDQVIGKQGLLSNKTRILITHGLMYLPGVDIIFVMDGGQIRETGTFEELLKNNGIFVKCIKMSIEKDAEKLVNDVNENAELKIKSWQEMLESSLSEKHSRQSYDQTLINKRSVTDHETKSTFHPNMKLIEEELVEINSVQFHVYMSYLRSATYAIVFLALVSYILYMVFFVATNIFLSKWTETQNPNRTQSSSAVRMFLGVYGGLGAGQIIFILIQNFSLSYGTFLTSKTLHKKLLKSILRAPSLFFDITPTGRILNRLGQDIATVDVHILPHIRYWLISFSAVIGSIISIIIASPYFIIGLIPLVVIYMTIQKLFTQASRQLIRIDSVKRSPIISHFEESLAGVSSIRAYKVSNEFIRKCDSLTDEHQQASYIKFVSYRWLPIHLEFIGNIVIFLTSIIAVLTRSTIGAGLAGLSISLSLQISWTLSFMVNNNCLLESNIVSVERIEEYINIEQEAPWNLTKDKSASNWLSNGEIEFRNYSVRYRPELDLVLKDLNFVVRAGEKIGIVGRTGAGKSSLALGLFRMMEPAEGSIIIDGVDITKLGLHDLRQKLTIISQDPMVFCGTLRLNLDPFNEYRDSDLWTALEMAHLKDFVTRSAVGLDFFIFKNGENISAGQKQLICLARVLLKKPKILVLDEATSAIDNETDDLIQRSIRDQFHDCTVLTIAHRINTIMDYDRVLVLEHGRMRELDTPQNLLRNAKSIFYSMVKEAGLV